MQASREEAGGRRRVRLEDKGERKLKVGGPGRSAGRNTNRFRKYLL